MLIIAPSAIVKGTKHPNAAKLFMEYLYSIEASRDRRQALHHADAARGAGAPRARSRSTEVKTIRPTVEEIDKGIPEVIEQWRDTFGN